MQAAQAGRPEEQLPFLASFSSHAQQARVLVEISEA